MKSKDSPRVRDLLRFHLGMATISMASNLGSTLGAHPFTSSIGSEKLGANRHLTISFPSTSCGICFETCVACPSTATFLERLAVEELSY